MWSQCHCERYRQGRHKSAQKFDIYILIHIYIVKLTRNYRHQLIHILITNKHFNMITPIQQYWCEDITSKCSWAYIDFFWVKPSRGIYRFRMKKIKLICMCVWLGGFVWFVKSSFLKWLKQFETWSCKLFWILENDFSSYLFLRLLHILAVKLLLHHWFTANFINLNHILRYLH